MEDSANAKVDIALQILVKSKSSSSGMGSGLFEQDRDSRLIKVIIELLADFKTEEEVMNWLRSPCTCLECFSLSPQPARFDLLNSAYSFEHLMRNIKLTREEVWQ